MAHTTSTLTTEDNFKIFTQSWEVADNKANIILIHGYGEHSSRYEKEAKFFNDAGYCVYTYDHRGHGNSDGLLGYVERMKFLTRDMEHFINECPATDKPFFIYAHSMGGIVAVSHLLEYGLENPNFKGIVMTGPLLMPSRDTAPLLQKVAGIVGMLTPMIKTVPLNAKAISRDPQVVADYENDPLVYHDKLHARTGAELIAATKNTKPKFAEFIHPVLILHGEKDKLTEPDGSKEFINNCGSSDKELKLYPEAYHELTRDLDKDDVLNTMKKWMDNRV